MRGGQVTPGGYKRAFDALPVFPQALCRERPDLPWVPRGRSGESSPDARRAIRVCCTCPHVAACAAYAIAHPELLGIWGGLTTEQRHRLAGVSAEQVAEARRASLPVNDRECDQCGRTFRSAEGVRMHQRRQHTEVSA